MAAVSSSETQGQSVRSAEMAGRKFSSMGERGPGYQLSWNYFQKFKRMSAPDWAQKMLCIIVPNWRTASPGFFSWVCTRRLLSCHTCPVRSPGLCVQGKLLFSTFLTRNDRTSDESKNVWDAISRSNSICPEKILFLTHHNILWIIGSLRCSSDDKVKEALAWQGKKKLCTCITLFCTFLCRQLHDYPWKCLISHILWRT